MKIKAVCEATGLTDRTIRYYIEEELIAPAYTENYLGRKNYVFSQADVQALTDIAVLRKFGFSVPEVKKMILQPDTIHAIVEDLRLKKQTFIREEQELFSILSELEAKDLRSAHDLATVLSVPVQRSALPTENVKKNMGEMLLECAKLIGMALLIWLPIIIAGLIIVDGLRTYHYLKFEPKEIVTLLLVLLPSLTVLHLPNINTKTFSKKILKRFLLILCAVCIPASFIVSCRIITCSETTDFRYYREFDSNCHANRDLLFQKLFPAWPHYFVNEKQPDGSWETVYLDAHYYYRFIDFWDDTYDIYAEWPLEQKDFEAEVLRAQALFDDYIDTKPYKYITAKKGNYTCLILYSGDYPFETVTENYTYYIFAYDEQNLTVRYLCCHSFNEGVDQPYYLNLEWE